MNTMGITLIAFGLTIRMTNSILKDRYILITSYVKCLSIVLFGVGLTLRGLLNDSREIFSSLLTALGATGYILVLLFWSACLFFAARQIREKDKNGKKI